jgi:hypothetical protein
MLTGMLDMKRGVATDEVDAMGVADLDFLAKEWPVITGAPYLFVGAIIATIISAVPITWFIVSWGYRRQIAVFEDRLKLAAEKVELADRAKGDVEKQFHAYREAVAAGAGYDALAERVANVETAIEKLSAANNAVRSAIGIAIGASIATGISDSLSNTPLALRVEADKEQQN